MQWRGWDSLVDSLFVFETEATSLLSESGICGTLSSWKELQKRRWAKRQQVEMCPDSWDSRQTICMCVYIYIWLHIFQLWEYVVSLQGNKFTAKILNSNSALFQSVQLWMLECSSETHYWPVFDVRFGMWHMDEQQIMCRPSPSGQSNSEKKQNCCIKTIICDVQTVIQGL